MTEQDALEYIDNGRWSSMRLGLERIQELMDRLGNPEKRLKYVHVTGTNGKGSTCAMTASILKAAGYRVGMFTSPYIEHYSEQMMINGEPVSPDDFTDAVRIVKAAADSMSDHPSKFELITAAALVYYEKKQCDIVVMEVGMGGATDSTNVIPAPEVAVMTNVGLDHTEYLGDTLEKIATVKCGIIKSGCDVVCYDGASVVTDVVRKRCSDTGAKGHFTDFTDIKHVKSDIYGETFTYKGITYYIPLCGDYQTKNAVVAIEVIHALRGRGYKISDDNVIKGLAKVRWSARFEVLRDNPLFILDGGHNLQCAQALESNIRKYLSGMKITFLMGVLKDKDYEDEVKLLMPYAKEFICVTPDNERALPADKLADIIIQLGGQARAMQNVPDGVIIAMNNDNPVIAFGSLYMSGQIRRLVLGKDRI